MIVKYLNCYLDGIRCIWIILVATILFQTIDFLTSSGSSGVRDKCKRDKGAVWFSLPSYTDWHL